MSYRRYSRSSRFGRREMVAKYAGKCRCGRKVAPGCSIVYDYETRAICSCSACQGEQAAGAIVGPCWACGAPEGRFRAYGAVGTPVYCDACEETTRAADMARHPERYGRRDRPDASDLAYEDQCAVACGLDGFDRGN